jgi:hypothetical protein
MGRFYFVIPAKAGISAPAAETSGPEIPAFAGMTGSVVLLSSHAPGNFRG